MNESAFQRQVEELCRWRRLRYYHVTRTHVRDQPGFPDLVILGKDVIFAELKTETGKQSAAQIEWEYDLRAAGARFYLWRPSDLPEISRILATL